MYYDHIFYANNLHEGFFTKRHVTAFANLYIYIYEHKHKRKPKGENNALPKNDIYMKLNMLNSIF